MTPDWESAVHRASIDDLQHLLDAGADINSRDRHGQTALMIATADGVAPLVAWLVAHGADFNHAAKYGLTALMLAVLRGHVEAVRILAMAGASVDMRGSGAPGFAGKTALDLAVARGDPEIIEIIRSAAALQ